MNLPVKNIPLSVCLDIDNKLEGKINELFSENYIPKQKEVSISQCTGLAKQLIDEYKTNPKLKEIFSCLDTIVDVFKFVAKSEINEKKYEVISTYYSFFC